MLKKLDESSLEVDRIRQEKDQEIEILQEGMDATIEQLREAQQVCFGLLSKYLHKSHTLLRVDTRHR